MTFLQRTLDHAHPARLRDGSRVYLRALRETDLTHAQEYFASLSADSRYLRFMMATPTLTADTLALVADALHAEGAAVVVASVWHDGVEHMIGGARVVAAGRRGACEFAVSVSDAWQGRGCGKVLLHEVVRLARSLGYRRIEGKILAANLRMLAAAQKQRFQLRSPPGDPGVIGVSRRLYR